MKYLIRRDVSYASIRPRRTWPWLVIAGVLGLCFLVSGLAILPAFYPDFSAETADVLRTLVGPRPVAVLESISFKLQDHLNQFRSMVDGGKTLITFSQPVDPPQISATGIPPTLVSPIATLQPASNPSPIQQTTPTPPMHNVVADVPQIGWQAYGPSVDGAPAMARTMILLDPQRSYTGVALVRIDSSKLQLHAMAGTIEPSHPSGISKTITNLGMVSADDQPNLVAAFNGGFKGIHGHYGMMVDGFTLLPPLPGLATVAIYRDGHVAIGAWGEEINPSSDLVSFRQNCPLLVENGKKNPVLSLDNRSAWGYTGNTDITWRTGIGVTQDGRYLIYAVGNGTPAEILADALLKAGAYDAMQLDINQYYAHFIIYQPGDGPSGSFILTSERLLDQMINNPHLYLTPNVRDFFYLTGR
jgi:hypothetical protein